MKKYLLASVLWMVMTASWATTQDDVNFAQRQCQQRNDPDKCATYREIARAYQQERRDTLEYHAATKARRPMAGANYSRNETNIYNGSVNGAYRWNSWRKQYCYHNRNGSVQRCVN